MNGYLLDTHIVTAHLKQQPGVRQRIREAELAGHSVRLIEGCRHAGIAQLRRTLRGPRRGVRGG